MGEGRLERQEGSAFHLRFGKGNEATTTTTYILHTLGQKFFLKRQFSNGNCTIQVLLILQSCELIIVYCTIFLFLNHCVMPDGWESSEWFNHHHTLCMVSKGGYSKFYLDGCKSEGCIYAIMGPLDTKSEIGAISSVYNSQNSKSSL